MIHYTSTTTGLGLILAVVIFYLLRRNLLYTRYAVWWLLVALASVVLGMLPNITDIIARFLGVQYAPSLFFLIGLGLLFVKILTMDIDRSRQEQRLRRLAQEMVILEAKLNEARRTGGSGEEE